MNCKPGDLAIFVSVGGSPEFEANLGLIVEVIEAAPPSPVGPRWEVISRNRPIVGAALVDGYAFRATSNRAAVADFLLRPIRDTPEPEAVAAPAPEREHT